MKAYKVVRFDNTPDIYRSTVYWSGHVHYKIGSKALPTIGKLLCFTSYRMALKFYNDMSSLTNCAIPLGEATEVASVEILVDLNYLWHDDRDMIRLFWDNLGTRTIQKRITAPKKSSVCSSFTPLKLMKFRTPESNSWIHNKYIERK